MKKFFIIFFLILNSHPVYSQIDEWVVFKSLLPPSNKLSADNLYLSIAAKGIINKQKDYSTNSYKHITIDCFGNVRPLCNYIPDNFIACITQDKAGNIWIGTLTGGIAKYDGTGWTIYDTSNSGLPCNKIYSLMFDLEGKLWIGTTSGLVKFDGRKWIAYDLLNSSIPSNIIYSLAMDKAGNKWIGTAAGLAKFNGRRWTTFNVLNSKLPDDNVTAINIDERDVKWVGTFEGLVRIEGDEWKIYNTSNSGLPYDDIYSIYSDRDGKIFIQTWGGGVAILNKNKWIVNDSHNSGLPDNFISSIVPDEKGNRWIGTLSGLVKYEHGKWIQFKSTNSALPGNEVYSIFKDKCDNLWIGTANGLAVYKKGGVVSSLLPLKLFTVHIYNNNVSLSWQRELNDDIRLLEIERKTDNSNWEKIGIVRHDNDLNHKSENHFTDYYPSSGKNFYRIKQIRQDGSYQYSQTLDSFLEIPKRYFLEESFPNQSDSVVYLKFELPEGTETKLIVYDFLGREIARLIDGYKQPGIYTYKFIVDKDTDTLPNSDLHPLIYLYKIETKSFTSIKKFFLLR